ncbi:hypothetical protein [Paradesulfitobacterium ferrireducens]|uniref:hypothetical protein n=1 Tax=Paradesulfitobacterium ferrireducens TaxID=2816476 RepID=UPI001A8DCD0A|nr:hypothetical protein [Paradesulfitobacterium ferrireducens]
MSDNVSWENLKHYLDACIQRNEPAYFLLTGEPPTLTGGLIKAVHPEEESITLTSHQEIPLASILGFPEEGL